MDVNVRAFRVAQAATSEQKVPSPREVSGRKGGLIGGRSRAQSISAERRSQIARQASKARWAKASTERK